ncbi:hypothetical protein GCM10009583_29400 [Ornithinicoccus hortensis]|uniref:Uncharacterized protein n=1 Tax=Ornithinicoccus hortensis TaxID=82346 RepID=A0A542YSE1_9MICO|nr:hypothetical protein FB467_2149 [Ornithinicoccus hortensis]
MHEYAADHLVSARAAASLPTLLTCLATGLLAAAAAWLAA